MKRCYLIRHGQTAWNRENRIQGHSDLPLDAVGETQAKQLSVFFASYHLRSIFTSHLRRSRQTAEAIAAGNGHGDPVVEQALAEMYLGAWEGLTPEEIDQRFGGAYEQWKTTPSLVRIPEAEGLEAFRTRVRTALSAIVDRLGEGEHVIVSHGGVIAALLADLLDADYDAMLRRLRLDNAGITAFEFGTPTPHVLWINRTTHLDPSGGAA